MHPSKFLSRFASPEPRRPEQDQDRIAALSVAIAGRRNEAVAARKASGIEAIWKRCDEQTACIDELNRHENTPGTWEKSTSTTGPLVSNMPPVDDVRSTVFVRLTGRYVDNASAKMAEILLPIDEKAFSIKPTPIPDLVELLEDTTPAMNQSGQPVMKPDGTPVTNGEMVKSEQKKAEEKAKKAETRIYDWMIEGKYPAEMRKVIRDAARLGVGVLKGPVPEIRKSRALSVKDGVMAIQMQERTVPAVRWIDPWNLFPADGCGENIHDGDYILERAYLSEKQLKQLRDDPTYLKEQIDLVLKQGPGLCYEEGREEEGKTKSRYEVWYYYGIIKRDDVGAVVVDQDIMAGLAEKDEISMIVTMVNNTIIKATPNPMESGRFPYNVMSWSRRSDYWAGIGIAEQIDVPQRIVNGATRAMLNNAGLASGVQIVLDQQSIEPADKTWVITPNKIWYKTIDGTGQSVADAFAAIKIPSIQGDMINIIQYGMRLAEESTNIPLVTQGRDGPTTPQTFGQAELQNSNAHTWLRDVAHAFDDQMTVPVVDAFYEWLLLDPTVPDDEKGDFEINAHGSTAMVERAIQEQVYLGLLQASGNPAFKLDPGRLMEQYLKAKRIDPRDVQMTEEQQQKMEQNPPPPPPQVAVAQIRAQSDQAVAQLKSQTELQRAQIMAGGDDGGIEMQKEQLRSETALQIQQMKSVDEGEKDERAFQLALMQFAMQEKISLQEAKVLLAKETLSNRTKRQMANAEIALAMSQKGDPVSVVRDEVSTDSTP